MKATAYSKGLMGESRPGLNWVLCQSSGDHMLYEDGFYTGYKISMVLPFVYRLDCCSGDSPRYLKLNHAKNAAERLVGLDDPTEGL